jgi:peptide/nickel transport system ATP-binding protein
MVLITHDLGLVAQTVDRVLVMYAGHMVEAAPTADLFAAPLHPYTRGLLDSVPHPPDRPPGARRARLREIKGMVPALDALPPGCPYAPRCPLASTQCRDAMPPFAAKLPGHSAACWHSDRVAAL